MNNENAKAAVVAIIGRPSCGKSTFLNTVCGHKVSIISAVPQTTRNAVRGIINTEQGQLVFIDTPGYHISEKKLNLKLAAIVKQTLKDADCILYLIDATRDIGEEEERAAELIKHHLDKTVVGINKIDLHNSSPAKMRLFINETYPDFGNARIFDISAEKNTNITSLTNSLFSIAPVSPPLYPPDYYTDQQIDFRIAEIIREKAMNILHEELPHSLYVEIADLETRKNGKELWIRAFLVVERESQKGIAIGKGASVIQKIRSEAISDCIRIFDYKINLNLQVKVHKNWRQKDILLTNLIDR